MKEKKTKKPISQKSFIIHTLRRASFKWKPRYEAVQQARVSRGLYRCAMCFSACFKVKDIVVDHKLPVVDPIDGWKSWDDYIDRMFCEKDGFQILCRPCHDKKTKGENTLRDRARN